MTRTSPSEQTADRPTQESQSLQSELSQVPTKKPTNEQMLNTHFKEGEQLSQLYTSLLKTELIGTIKFGKKIGGSLDHSYGSKKSVSHPSKTVRINKELRTMSHHLPLSLSNAAFVRYDEGNIDFLRALVFGAKGTPYAHGGFLFDIFMGNYPYEPPKVQLLTTGKGNVRFNPNLYSNGHVCLSLLGTWRGTGCETWTVSSSLMQVVVSIQSLIMSDDVYGKEPGYEASAKTEEGKMINDGYCNIVKYNNVMHGMIDHIKNPPKGFEQVTAIHFYLKKDIILEDVKTWVDTALWTKAKYTGLVSVHNASFASMFSDHTKYGNMMNSAYRELKAALDSHKLRVARMINTSGYKEESGVVAVEKEPEVDNTEVKNQQVSAIQSESEKKLEAESLEGGKKQSSFEPETKLEVISLENEDEAQNAVMSMN